MKYEFKKIDNKTMVLKYKDQEKSFEVNTGFQAELQSLNKKARLEMLKDLNATGQSLNSFTIEKKENGKTYYDDANRKALEEIYIQDVVLEFFNDFCVKNFDLDMTSLINDIGLTTEEEGEKFSKDLVSALSGNIPR